MLHGIKSSQSKKEEKEGRRRKGTIRLPLK